MDRKNRKRSIWQSWSESWKPLPRRSFVTVPDGEGDIIADAILALEEGLVLVVAGKLGRPQKYLRFHDRGGRRSHRRCIPGCGKL